jgi:hypothetical protein
MVIGIYCSLLVQSLVITINYSAIAIYSLHKSLGHAKSSQSSLVVSWQRIYESHCNYSTHDVFFSHVKFLIIAVWQLRSCFCGAPSLTRGRVCLLYMLLALASTVFLGSEPVGTRDHSLLSQIPRERCPGIHCIRGWMGPQMVWTLRRQSSWLNV